MEEDDPNRDAMNLLCDLFALSAIEKDRAWFLEHGRLSNARAKAVTAMVNELCRRVRPICDHLVDAFDIPPQMLRAEIILSAP
jgi:acyl-CoA oxidase